MFCMWSVLPTPETFRTFFLFPVFWHLWWCALGWLFFIFIRSSQSEVYALQYTMSSHHFFDHFLPSAFSGIPGQSGSQISGPLDWSSNFLIFFIFHRFGPSSGKFPFHYLSTLLLTFLNFVLSLMFYFPSALSSLIVPFCIAFIASYFMDIISSLLSLRILIIFVLYFLLLSALSICFKHFSLFVCFGFPLLSWRLPSNILWYVTKGWSLSEALIN